MLLNPLLILAAAIIPFSDSRAIPGSEVPGFKLVYKNLGTLPNTSNTIQPTSYDTLPSTSSTCASMCASIVSCRFFVIYAPFDGADRSRKVCQYYSEADPYQNSDGTQFTHQVRELCGYQKQDPSFVGNTTIHGTKNAKREQIEEVDGRVPCAPEVPAPPTNNCTNATYVSKRRDTTGPIQYQPVGLKY
ncbi:hypothetical protein TWF173_005330 [Orbilia oligospora]|nr:hypothetical protein TWF173_005330 [Orbilia oligospora]